MCTADPDQQRWASGSLGTCMALAGLPLPGVAFRKGRVLGEHSHKCYAQPLRMACSDPHGQFCLMLWAQGPVALFLGITRVSGMIPFILLWRRLEQGWGCRKRSALLSSQRCKLLPHEARPHNVPSQGRGRGKGCGLSPGCTPEE